MNTRPQLGKELLAAGLPGAHWRATVGVHLARAQKLLARARAHLDMVPADTSDLAPLARKLLATCDELEARMAAMIAVRKELAGQLSSILKIDLIRNQPTVAEIGAAVRRVADLP